MAAAEASPRSRRPSHMAAPRAHPQRVRGLAALAAALAPAVAVAVRTASRTAPPKAEAPALLAPEPANVFDGFVIDDLASPSEPMALANGSLAGSLLESWAMEVARPKRSAKSKSSKKARKLSANLTSQSNSTAGSSSRGSSSKSSSSRSKDSEWREVVHMKALGSISSASIRCRSKSISIFISELEHEIAFGGEAMSQIIDDFCKSADEEPDLMTILPGLLRLASGSLFLGAIATPGDGGCEVSAKAHGASVPLQCFQQGEEYRLVRIGSSVADEGATRFGRQARPAFEVTYLGEELNPKQPRVPCSCEDAREVVLQAIWVIFVFFDLSMTPARKKFAESLFLIDGLAGRLPSGDGSEDPIEFTLKHIGACIRQAFDEGGDIGVMQNVLNEFRRGVSKRKLLVSWRLNQGKWQPDGVLSAMFLAYDSLVDRALAAAASGDIAPERPLCTLPKPTKDELAAEVADENAAKNLVKTFKAALQRLPDKEPVTPEPSSEENIVHTTPEVREVMAGQ